MRPSEVTGKRSRSSSRAPANIQLINLPACFIAAILNGRKFSEGRRYPALVSKKGRSHEANGLFVFAWSAISSRLPLVSIRGGHNDSKPIGG
jgi:hypothetical protein